MEMIALPLREKYVAYLKRRQGFGLVPSTCKIVTESASPEVGLYVEKTYSTSEASTEIDVGRKLKDLPKNDIYMTMRTCAGTGEECLSCEFYQKKKDDVTIYLPVPTE